jgi:predicted permease
MMRFLFSIALIPLGLAVGLGIRNIIRTQKNKDALTEKIRKTMQIIVLLFTNPVAFAGAVWALPLENVEIMILPVLGFLAIAISGVYSIVYTRNKKMTRPMRGSHFCVSFYTNIGSIGALVIYALLGEAGFILLPFYKLVEPLMYFAVGFPVASLFGEEKHKDKRSILQILKDPFVMVSMGGIFLGLLFNLLGLPRPAFYSDLNNILVPLGSFLLLISIGIAMHFQSMKKYALSTTSILTIKYILVPLTVTTAAYILGMGRIMDGLPLKVVFILSSMPSGFMAIMPASLYNLDLDYANTGWLASMIALVVVVPWLYFCLNYIIPYLI